MCLSSCVKEDNPPNLPTPEQDPREYFTGIYDVYKTENGQWYVMEVNAVGPECKNCDSLDIINYCDLFTFRTNFQKILNDSLYFYTYLPNPATDKFGRRWVTGSHENGNTPYRENVLKNDTIYIYRKLNNIQFYFDDGVPYMDTTLNHVAIKRN